MVVVRAVLLQRSSDLHVFTRNPRLEGHHRVHVVLDNAGPDGVLILQVKHPSSSLAPPEQKFVTDFTTEICWWLTTWRTITLHPPYHVSNGFGSYVLWVFTPIMPRDRFLPLIGWYNCRIGFNTQCRSNMWRVCLVVTHAIEQTWPKCTFPHSDSNMAMAMSQTCYNPDATVHMSGFYSSGMFWCSADFVNPTRMLP